MIAMLDPKMFTTFVTGATSGIGEATCRRFVSAGAKVIATGRRADRLEALKAELGEACSIAALDVRDRVAVEKTVAGLPEPFRRINVVVANAGHGIGMQLAQQASIADWEDMVATNIKGCSILCTLCWQACCSEMKDTSCCSARSRAIIHFPRVMCMEPAKRS